MTYAEIKNMVASIGLPYAYYQWHDDDPERPSGPPFVCFYFSSGEDFYADGKNYAKIDRLIVEHYADEPDLLTDAEIGEILNAHGLTFQWDRQYIRDQRMWITTFESGVNIEPMPETTDPPENDSGNDNITTEEGPENGQEG